MTTTWRNVEVSDLESRESIARIVAASQVELLASGVLGFRTQNVARLAKCSVSIIYHYFEDRADLIVSVLGNVFERMVYEFFNEAYEVLERQEVITPDFLLQLIPDLDSVEHDPNVRLWLMAISLSTESEKLRQAITGAIENQVAHWSRFFEMVNSKLQPGSIVDLESYQVFLRLHFLYYNSLFGEHRVSNEAYKSYMTQVLLRSSSEVS